GARVRIIRAAGPVFASRGFDGATVREICTAAEVNVASIAYYFGDKMGLYREIIQGIREARERQFPAPLVDAEPRRMLHRIVQTLLSRMLVCDPSGWETQLMMREMDHPTLAFESIIEEFFRPLFDRLIDTFDRLLEGEAPRYTLEQLALSVVGQCLYYRLGSNVLNVLIPEERRLEHYNIDSLTVHITSVMLSAVDSAGVLREQATVSRWAEQTESPVEKTEH
ncbi:MAG: CerR family C-terminal domain-containing protein, partial [Rubripirellula sp.]|nr:CerR family C-terminal domain-containing protein [Rubripirellula sp.]